MRRNSGTTPSERQLAGLAERSFLTLWTYPNLYRDQGDGKEVCDLIVVFDNDVILFSDKEVTFPSGALLTAWSRWYRRAILESIDQLRGAKRWITQHPNRLFTDRECASPFPFAIDPKKARFHLVAVAKGAVDRCRLELGGSGSLVIEDGASGLPFTVAATHHDEVVLILDEVTLPLILAHLDTTPDFIAYLRARAAMIKEGRFLVATGEENILAYYIASHLKEGTASFPGDDGRRLAFDETLWQGVSTDNVFAAYRERVSPSYAWDALVESFSACAFEGTMVLGNERGFIGHEERLRNLARTTRDERRELALAFAGLLERVAEADDGALSHFRCVRLSSRADTMFAFLSMPPSGTEDDDYRAARADTLLDYCFSIKADHPNVAHVVGVATSLPAEPHSEDIAWLNATDWTPQLQKLSEEVRRETGYYTAPQLTRGASGAHSNRLLSRDQQRKRRNDKKRLRRKQRQR